LPAFNTTSCDYLDSGYVQFQWRERLFYYFLYGKAKLPAFVLISYTLQVIHSARANASHNHGLDPERLIVGNILKFIIVRNEVVLLHDLQCNRTLQRCLVHVADLI